MGCLCSRPELATACSLHIELPAEIVWDTLKDLDALVETVSFIKGYERLNGEKGEFRVGTRWRETRRFTDHQGEDLVQIRTIVGVSESPPYFVSTNMIYQTPKGKTENIENTSSITVQPIDEDSCSLVVSVAFETGNVVINRCCGRMALKYAEPLLMQELEDYAQAATNRQKAKEGR